MGKLVNHWPKETEEFFRDVVGIVDATTFERYCLWEFNQRGIYSEKKSWEDWGFGLFLEIGSVDKRPVTLGFWKSKIDGQWIAFMDWPSQVVDHKLIDKWLNKYLPKSAFRKDGFINRTDANNFTNVFRNR